MHEAFPSAEKTLKQGILKADWHISDLAGLNKTALFDRDDIIVAHFDNIKAVFAAESVVETLRPLVGMLLGLLSGVKTPELFKRSPFGTAAEFLEDYVILFHESLLVLEIR